MQFELTYFVRPFPMNMQPNRLFNLDFIRSLSILLIIFFHYNVWAEKIISKAILLFEKYQVTGSIGVSLFIILSGAALMCSTQNNFELKQFFKKRFMSIFPLFYLAYLGFVFSFFILYQKNPFPGRNPATFILTLIGMDGFLLYKIPNFYIIGEWFLGFIIILYLIFPIIRYFFILNKHLLLVTMVLMTIVVYNIYSFDMAIQHFPLSRILEFSFGMYFISYFKEEAVIKNIMYLVLTLVGSVAVYKLFKTELYVFNILGMLSFVFLSSVSTLMKSNIIVNIVKFLSRYSYAAFLVHHQILIKIITYSKNSVNSKFENILLFVATLGIIYGVAYVLQNLLQYLLSIVHSFKLNAEQIP